MVLLVLYEELAGYTVACLKHMVKVKKAEVHVFRKQINKDAPFQFSTDFGAHFYQREEYTEAALIELAKKINPDIIHCGGWIFPPYLKICKYFKGKIPTLGGFDNWWSGNAKQQVARLISPFYFKRMFSHCFVPGLQQKEYAKKLGYDDSQIKLGAYCCDYDYFTAEGEKYKAIKEKEFPKRFLFIGRYVPEKGINLLWSAFLKAKINTGGDWELWCLGVGSIPPLQAEGIQHFGFIQPADMCRFIKDCGVFVLPSVFEPWGVVVHEMAAAGFPIITTEAVGAAGAFVEDSKNGFMLKENDENALQLAMEKMMKSNQEALVSMGRKSCEMAKKITPETWCNTFYEIIGEFKK